MAGFAGEHNGPLPIMSASSIQVPKLPILSVGKRLIEEAQTFLSRDSYCPDPKLGYLYSLDEVLEVWQVWYDDRELRSIKSLRQRDSRFASRFLRHYTAHVTDYEERWRIFFEALAVSMEEHQVENAAGGSEQ